MKKHIRNSGFAAVCLGALMLIAGYALGWTDSNAYLLSAAALVVGGAVTHIYFIKKESCLVLKKVDTYRNNKICVDYEEKSEEVQ